jgi:hypothetical protein
MIIQVPSIILPTVSPLGTETQQISGATKYYSLEFSTRNLQEKCIQIFAEEVDAVGAPGALWAWVELSPYPTTTTGLYWAAIGGGGGLVAPVLPTTITGTGTSLTIQGAILAWTVHSEYARLVVQTPAFSATAVWLVQAMISGK